MNKILTARRPLRSPQQQWQTASEDSRLRAQVRAKYPVLRDGSLINVDGDVGRAGFAPRVITQALTTLRLHSEIGVLPATRTVNRAERNYPRSPDALRRIMIRTDHLAITPPVSTAAITILEIAPRKMYAHWQIPQAVFAEGCAKLGDAGSVLTLRFFDITDQPHDTVALTDNTFDIDTNPNADHQYIDFWAGCRAYLVELGLRATDGRFLPLARSQAVQLLRDEAGRADDTFRVAEHFKCPLTAPNTPSIYTAATPLVALPEGVCDWALRDIQAETWTRRVYTNFLNTGLRVLRHAAAIKPRAADLLRKEYAEREQKRQALTITPRQAKLPVNRLTTEPTSYLVRLEPARPLAEKATTHYPLTHLDRTVTERKRQASMAHLSPLRVPWQKLIAVRDSFERWLPSVAAMHAPILPPRKRPVTALDFNSSKNLISALADAGVELEAELILRGRVQPGRKVKIGGRIINTAADGSFRVSCILREGKLHVPVEVVVANATVRRGVIAVTAQPA